VLVPLALGVEGAPPLPTTGSLVGFAYLSLAATALAFVLWFDGIRRLPAVAPPLLGLAAPVTGAAIGWVALGQSLTTVQLAGFAVTLGAIAHGATRGASEAPEHRPDSGSTPDHHRIDVGAVHVDGATSRSNRSCSASLPSTDPVASYTDTR
jgi:probable blue pigment (indigoidine) exporter